MDKTALRDKLAMALIQSPHLSVPNCGFDYGNPRGFANALHGQNIVLIETAYYYADQALLIRETKSAMHQASCGPRGR